jgi:hypothetical protein
MSDQAIPGVAAVKWRNVARPLDFIVIGAAKSGTTSLYYYLRDHPRLVMPADKEAPFFTKDSIYERGWDEFRDKTFRRVPAGALVGKVTPRYLGDLHVAERMYAAMPNTRLIALLRNPVDRAHSKYRMTVRYDKETRTFADLVADELEPSALARARTEALGLRQTVVVRSEYGRLLDRYLQWFAPSQLLVLFTEEMEQRPAAAIDEVLRFLDLPEPYESPNIGERYHVADDHKRFSSLGKWLRRSPVTRTLWQLVPSGRRASTWRWFKTTFGDAPDMRGTSAPADTALPADTRAALIEFYRPDVRRLEEIVGRPVPWDEFRREG